MNGSDLNNIDKIQRNICEAIDIIVQRAISQASYDKTIQAVIVKCVDSTIGKYSVRYQDSTFYAYSSNIDISYSDGTAVYVLIPSGNMSKDKTIIGAVKNLGTNFLTVSDEIDKYSIIGDNNIKNNNNVFGLKSYSSENITQILYSKDPSFENKINVNEATLTQCLMEADNIICGATFRTNLPLEQQFNGDYGLIIAIDFRDNSTGAEVTREYILDTNNMRGNPYRLVTDTKQYAIFNIDSANYLKVNYIAIFCYDFPHSHLNPKEDIWIKDIELTVAERMTEEEINGYAISFITPKGVCFDSSHSENEIITLQARVKVKSKIVDPDSQPIDFYWFIENTNVNSQNEKYNQYGGKGWECLNQYNLISSEEDPSNTTVQWVPAKDTWTIAKKDIVSKEILFKCVVIYNGVSISKEIAIKRLDADWDITISSSQGTSFYFDNGQTTLTCLINGQSFSDSGYIYCWAKIGQNDYFETLSDTEELNKDYTDTLKKYNDLKKNIEDEKVLVAETKEELNQLENKLKEFNETTRIDKNIIYNVKGKSIDKASLFKCSVYKDNTFLGTGSITLTNQFSSENGWNLVIHNSEKIFKYNEYGISPADPSNLKPAIIEPLTFSLYDNLGNKIDENAIKIENIKWTVPITNTMLKMILDEEGTYIDNEDDGTRTYSKLRSFSYKIADSYNIRNQRNNITLEVKYNDIKLTATTNLIFIKQGDAGTNGSDYICRIVPNSLKSFLEIPMATKNNTTKAVQWNFDPLDENILFKVQLWHNQDLIFSDSTSGSSSEGNSVKVKWSILKNKYSYSIEDNSSFAVNEDTGSFTYGDFSVSNPANILKVEVTHNNVTYYATLPIITAIVESGYGIKLKEDTGFNYVEYTSDGKQPIYDSSFPFEIIVTEDINNYTEDISLKTNPTYAVVYEWSILGSIKENYPPTEIEKHSILDGDYFLEDLNKNQKVFRVVDSYDGECVNNAVKCVVTQKQKQVAMIHIPIHFMLNRYGHSAINGWDGNSVNINEEGGFILTPQVGAGQKESDNSFTGILMGKVKEGLSQEENGLFGYYKGQRSIFLDAKTGTAKFGLNNIGQIIIDPTQKKALLYSGNYSEQDKTGMLIDLTTPEIKYGNGNFSVDSSGRLIAKGNGSNIGGCKIENGMLQVPAAYITGKLIAEQIDAGAITVGGLDETLREMIDNATAKVEVQYALSDSLTEPPTSGWSPVAPDWETGKYMWQKTVTVNSAGERFESDPTCIAGAIGQTGAAGRGIKTTDISYQKSNSGVNTPTGKWESTVPSVGPGEYLWARIIYIYTDDQMDTLYTVSMMGQTGLQGLQGPQGDQGIQGPKGDSGQTSYFHIKYSTVSNPTSAQMTENPSEYIGTYVDFDPNDSTDPSRYTWSRFRGLQGEDGTQGIPGKNGENGQTSYLHIKYSNDGGKSFTDKSGETPGDYIGQYVDFTQTDSMEVTKYTWSKIKGETGPQGLQGLQGPQGLQGIQGQKGDSGQTTYFHIKYSAVASPATASQMTETPSEYIGTYVDFNQLDSDNPKTYTWARFQGLQGKDGTQGIPGTNGINGQTSYLHIKYSNNNGLSFTGNLGEDVGDYIGQYVDFVQADSTEPTRYTWSKIKGETGPQGLQGVGVKSIVPEYYLSTSSTKLEGGSWSETPQPYSTGKYYWTRSKVTYDNGTVVYTSEVLDNAINDANRLAHSVDSDIANWCYQNNRTYINGSKIYAGTVTAVQIAAHTITANEITTSDISGTHGWINLNLGTFNYGPNKLKFDGSTLTVDGNITATTGSIGNWKISGSSLYKGTNSFGASGSSNMYLGDNGISISNTFKVSSSGALTATGASITGGITATSFVVNQVIYFYQNSSSQHLTCIGSQGAKLLIGAEYSGGEIIQVGNGADCYGDLHVYNTIYEGNTSLSSKYAAYSHSHNYLSASGGTMTGALTLPSGSSSGLIFSTSGAVGIYTTGAQNLSLKVSNDRILLLGATDKIWTLCPSINKYFNLGTSSHRWETVYATTGTINSSDVKEKNTIMPISEKYESVFEQLQPVSYKFNGGHRIHTGFISQDIERAMEENDLSPLDWAAFCKDPDEKGSFIYGLRYGEIIALNTHMIQKLMKRIAQLEEQLQQ